MNNLEIAQALVFEPRKAFGEIAERPRFWFPLLALLLATVVITVWYLSIVDMGWMLDQQIRGSASGRSMSEEQIVQTVEMMGRNRGLVLGLGIVQIVLVVPIVYLLIPALYYFLVGKVVAFERSFKQWFAFISWVMIPGVVAMIPAAILLATSGTNQIRQEALKTLSVNALLFHRAPGESGFSFLSYLDVFVVATFILSLIGVKVWSGRSWVFAALFVGIPWVLVLGPWAWFSLR